METQRDPQLWKMAKARAGFKGHLFVYLFINAGLWLIWGIGIVFDKGTNYPWPIWTTLGWGIGLLSHYLSVYTLNEKQMVEREYQKLLNKQ
ncbi:MAG: 2TM domain-containing protein [Spirosomataceae bacterium]